MEQISNNAQESEVPARHASMLRSIAKSIEPAFPNAAEDLRGIAREMDDAADM